MINKALLIKIQKWAIDKDWNEAFGGKSKGNRHLFRVNSITKFLSQKENADVNICLAGAWLHDIGLIFGNKNHESAGLVISNDFLSKLGVCESDRKQVLHCIEAHEGTVKPFTLEAKVVHDADVLDKTGILGLIRHAWKVTNTSESSKTSKELAKEIINHLLWRNKQLKTESAKKLASNITKEFRKCLPTEIKIAQFLDIIIPFTNKGLTSDKISKRILASNAFDKNIKKILKVQLGGAYEQI